MNRTGILRLCAGCLLACLFSASANALGFSFGNSQQSSSDKHSNGNRPWGNIEAAKPAKKYQPPPSIPGSYYPGASPDAGWYPGGMQQNGHVPSGPPTIEVELEGSVFYEQQNIVYSVHVVSDVNIKTLKPEMPRVKGAALEQLEGPITSTRMNGRPGRQQIINTYRYKLMPLRPGEITLPAIRFTGTYAESRQSNRGGGAPPAASAGGFSIVADKGRTLQVKPADPEVTPWLPLHDLRLRADMPQQRPARAGEPVTLEIELKAKGALGNQLPSLLQQLQSPHYRIYRDATTVKSGMSAGGAYVTGSRNETYTLIPLEDGWIRLPEVVLAWWDVDTHSARHAVMPFGHAEPEGMISRASGQGEDSHFTIMFWAPLVIVMSLIAGYWLGAWHRTRPMASAVTTWVTQQAGSSAQQIRRFGKWLSPAAYLRQLRFRFAMLMPRSVKIWMCTRCLRDEDDPEAWCTQFRARVCEHLDLTAHAPLVQITEKIISTGSHPEPARLRELARSLDSAVYGGGTLDFPTWKRDLMQQLRPRMRLRKKSAVRRAGELLPELNPRSI